MRAHPGNPDSHYLLACHYQVRGRHKEAVEEFKKVLLIDPNYIRAYNGMGVSYDLLGEFTAAIEYYNEALKLDPNLDYVYNNLGYSYLLKGNLEDSIAVLKKAVSLNDRYPRFHNNLGLAYGERGDYDLALAEFKLANDEAKAHHNMAQLYFKKGLYDKAKSHYAIALKLDPSLTVVRTALKASDALARIFELNPDKAEPKQLVIPDYSNIKVEETEKIAAADRSPEMKASQEESTLPVDPAAMDSENEEAITSEQVNNEPEKLAVSNLANASVPSSSQKPDIERTEGLHELQVASFHSKEKAMLAAGSIKELGYEPNILALGNGNDEKWYRLTIGPFETKNEASTHKSKIEKEYRLSPVIIKTTAVKPEPEKILTKEQIAEKGKLLHLKDADIEISNGNGVHRMARRVGDYLKEKGVKVTRLTNANNFKHTETRIFYQKEYQAAADHLVEQLPVAGNKEETGKFDRPNIKIKILIGKDLVPHNEVFQNGKKS
jgi:Flp pilus assembly protein TadD/cell division septation protein DedD